MVGQTRPAQETGYGNDVSQAQASGARGVLEVAVQATVAVPHNFADTRPGRELAAEGEAGPYGVAKQQEWTSGEAVAKVRAKGKDCVKSSHATSEVDLGGAHSRAHLRRSSEKKRFRVAVAMRDMTDSLPNDLGAFPVGCVPGSRARYLSVQHRRTSAIRS